MFSKDRLTTAALTLALIAIAARTGIGQQLFGVKASDGWSLF